MASDNKFPVERRRRDASSQTLPDIVTRPSVPEMRRDSDLVKARLQRWIDLADAALGRKPPKSEKLNRKVRPEPVSESERDPC